MWDKVIHPFPGFDGSADEVWELMINFIVRRAGLLLSQQDFEWRWSVPLFQCLTVLEFSFDFVWFVFINHIFQFYYELCTYCNILDIYLS